MNPVPWLPADCLTGPRASEPVDALARAWSARWLPDSTWQVCGHWAADPAGTEGWTPLRDTLRARLGGAPRAVLRIALAMLGENERTGLTERDSKLLRRLAGHALDDLGERLDALFPRRDGSFAELTEAPWSLALGPAGEPLLSISVAKADLCALARSAFARLVAGPMEPRHAALADLQVGIAARLGSARLDLAALATLEPGDVIVLDSPVSVPATVLVADRATPLTCRVIEQDGAMALRLEQPA